MSDEFPIYRAPEIHRLLDFDGCIGAVREAMARFSAEGKPQPLRSITELAPSKLFALMPGSLPEPEGFGAKVLAIFPDAAHPGRSAHRGIVVLFERAGGEVECIADAEAVTEIRTAAASAVATHALARADARRLAIFGCGRQAASHVRALARVRPFEEVLVWGRSYPRASEFARRLAEETRLRVRAVADARAAADSADVICTVTTSATPVLLGEWVRPGTHVNVVGSSHAVPVEIDHALVLASRFIVDSRRSALAAAAEFLRAKEAGLIGDDHIAAEIGEVLIGRIPGRRSPEEITVYKSLGHIVQDLAAVTYLHARSKRESRTG